MSLEIQWTDTDPATGGARFVRAERFAGRWRFKTRHRRREDWTLDVPATKAMWVDLLDGLERRLPRREGVSEADVTAVKKILNALHSE